jgi:arylsulfatase
MVVGIGTLGVFGFSYLKETTQAQTNSKSGDERPNVIIIASDDMAYADMAAFGSEISTPNLDALTKQGMMLTNFHTGPTCSPARSMILTGVDNHRTGLGSMRSFLTENQKGKPGYEGMLNKNVVTVATVLKDAGYHTYMTGKWHLGEEKGYWPSDRGFEEVFGILQGEGDHFGTMEEVCGDLIEEKKCGWEITYVSNDQVVEVPKDFDSGRTYTDKMIEFIEKNRGSGKPFFGFLAHTLPHVPLQAPKEYIDKYINTYSVGWDEIRAQRFERQKKLGIIPDYLELPPRWSMVSAWDSLSPEEQKVQAKSMAVYAGMVEYMDVQVGRLIDYLKKSGQYENTIIIYFNDNGASTSLPAPRTEGYDNSYENLGEPNSLIATGYEWAQVMGTPHYAAKGTVAQGGIQAHFAAVYPRKIVPGRRSDAFASVLDLAPTILDYAGVSHPAPSYEGRFIHPMDGKSMRPLLEGTSQQVYTDKEHVAFELWGTTNKALYMGDWKILKLGDKPWGNGASEPWKLYNLRIDPTETKDLSRMYPEKLQEMIKLYEQEERDWGFVPAE